MTGSFNVYGEWLMQSALAGGLILLLGCLFMLLTKQPARRQRLGEFSMLAALLTVGLSGLPAWLPVNIPMWKSQTVEVEPIDSLKYSGTADVFDSSLMELEEGQAGDDYTLMFVPIPEEAEPEYPAGVQVLTEVNLGAGTESTGREERGIGAWLIVGYLAVAAFLLVRCLFGYLGLRRLWQGSTKPPEFIARLFATLTGIYRRKPRLGVSRKLVMPVSFGLVKPTVLLPSRFGEDEVGERKEEEVRWVLVHELTHLERGDAWSCLLSALTTAVFFYVPWVWWLRRQVRLCQEYVADAAAAQLAGSEDYAEYLVTLSRRTFVRPRRTPIRGLQVTGVLGSPSELFRRITMLLKSKQNVERACPRRWSLAALAGFVGVAVFASGVSLRAADEKNKEASPAATPLTMLAEVAVQEPDGQGADEAKKHLAEMRRRIEEMRRKHEQEIQKAEAEMKKAQALLERSHQELVARRRHAALVAEGAAEQAERVKVRAADDLARRVKEALKGVDLEPDQAAALHRRLVEALKPRVEDEEEMTVRGRFIRPPMAVQPVQPPVRALIPRDVPAMPAQPSQGGGFGGGFGGGQGGYAFGGGQGGVDGMRGQWIQAMSKEAGVLGVALKVPDPELADQLGLDKGQGLVILRVLPESAAAKAGLKNHDILVQFEGQAVTSHPEKFIDAVKKSVPQDGEKAVHVIVLRKGKKEDAKVLLKPAKKDGAKAEEQVRQRIQILQDGELKDLELEMKEGLPRELKLREELLKNAEGKFRALQLEGNLEEKIRELKLKELKNAKGAKQKSVMIEINDGSFEAKRTDDDVEIAIYGKIDGDDRKVQKISIKQGGKVAAFESLDKVPEEHRDEVKELIGMVGKGKVEINKGAR